MEEPIPRLTYVLVFVCKQCGHDICMPFHTEDPEVEVQVTCKACGWKGTVRCAKAVKVLCKDASDLGL
jgi:DNA replicative helicase MCM subunit Mcm2 (Cdc46/Mcm family)